MNLRASKIKKSSILQIKSNAKKAEKNLQESNPNFMRNDLSVEENNNTFKEENLVDEEPTCDVCKGLSEEHADNCDNLKIKLNEYILVKLRSYPIMPLVIFGNCRCLECKELKIEVSG